jgi:hypothetical protein
MEVMNKVCNDCGLEYPKTNEFFNYTNKSKGYLSPYCKACIKVRNHKNQKRYYHENKERILKRTKEYRKNNSRSTKQRSKAYYEKNRDRILKQCAKYRDTDRYRAMVNEREKRKRNENPAYKLHTNVSRLVRFGLAKTGGKANGKIWEKLQYDSQQLKEHLEKQFDENMTWDNYGSYWHVDHIYPRSLLPYTSLDDPNFAKCWAISNLQPLEVTENIRKSNKVLDKSK